MRIPFYLILIVFLAIDIFLCFDLINTKEKISKQAVELKKITALYKEKLQQYKLQEEIAEIRELGFIKPIRYKSIDKEDVEDMIKKEVEEEFIGKDKSIDKYEKVLKKFGFIKQDENLLSCITSLYSEQVQGVYDEETGEMLLVKGVPLTGNIQKMFLVHELTHALQDQHFNLKNLPLKSDSEDKALACLSLIEGDATLAMFEYYKGHLKIYRILWDLLSYLSVDQSQFYSSPYYIRENLIFPYKWGLKFVTDKYAKGGWQEINKLYNNPPESTEQIMHPEKYPMDKPVNVNIKETILNYELLDSNTLGEFNIRVLLSIYIGVYEGISPSSGWAGDKWQVWQDPNNGNLKLIWHTVWDTKKDADEFFYASRKMIRRQYRNISTARISKKDNQVKLYW